MERPSSMEPAAILAEKVRLLKAMKTIEMDDLFLGQFTGNSWKVAGKCHTEPGYLDDPGVPKDSRCPTFAAAVLQINNERWQGVPFVMKAGKGLDERMCEVR